MATTLEEMEGIMEREVPRLLGALRAAGMWKSSALAKFFQSSPPEAQEVEGLIAELLPDAGEEEADSYVPYLLESVSISKTDRRRQSYLKAITPVWEVAAEEMRRKRDRDAEEYERLFERQRLGKALRAVPPKPASGRTGVQHRESRELDGDPRGREKGEARTRDHWIAVMGQYLEEDGVSAVSPKLLAAGRRAATLRTRILAWRSYRGWLRETRGVTLPRGPEDYIDYLLLRADEPCSRGTLDGVMALFSFLEGVYGRGKGSRWVDVPYYQAAAKEVRSNLTLRLDGAEVRKALRPTWALLAGLENHVMNEGVPVYDRVLAWYACVSSWCMLRFDDHRGWLSGQLKEDALGWSWDLVRTKTTGRGKASELRPVALATEAYIQHKDWFVTGHAVLREMSPSERDYLLTVPPAGGDAQAVPREVSYEEYVCRMRGMLSGVGLGDGQVGKALSELYSAHTWRFFMPSAAASLGYTQEYIHSLGTWSVKGGEGYNKMAKELVRLVQGKVAATGRAESHKKDVFGDRLDQPDTIRRLVDRGLDEDSARIVSRRLVRDYDDVDDRGADEGEIATVGAASSSSSGTASGIGASGMVEHASGRLPKGITGYVVSVVGRGKWRCLHYLGLCYRVPGVDYFDFQQYGQVAPGAELYDKFCRQCWPHGMRGDDEPGDETAAEGGETDCSDSTAA